MKISDIEHSFKQYFILEKGNKAKSYKSVIATLNMMTEFLGYDDIDQIKTPQIREFLNTFKEERLWTSKTYRNHWQNIKSFFEWCIKEKFIKQNPVIEIEKPKLNKTLPRCITKEDAQKILYHIDWYSWTYEFELIRNKTIISSLLYTGLRLQELLNLQVSDVNLATQEIYVKQGKWNKDRKVPIHPSLLPMLKTYAKEQKNRHKPSKWFFTGVKSDKQLNQKDIRRICKKISLASRVYFTPHMLRHTFGRLSVDADLNLYKIKEIMGHENITTTQRYLSVSTESIKRSFFNTKLI